MLLLAFSLFPACPGFCTGAGCDENFPNTLVSVQSVSPDLAGELDPTQQGINLKGNASMGNDWSLQAVDEGLLIGMPEADVLRWAPLENFPQSGNLSPGLSGRVTAEESGDRFGAAVVLLDDIAQEEARELLVGAPDKQGGGGRIGAGAAYLFSDLGGGFEDDLNAESALVRILGEEAGDHFGEAIERCGDLDGDGLSDLLVAAPDHASLAPRAGRVYLLRSSLVPELQAQILAASIGIQFTSEESGAQLGRAMNCSMDFTGDGIPDLLLSAPFEDSSDIEGAGAVHLIPGGPSLASGSIAESAAWTLRGQEAEAYFGSSLAVGDMNGDGLPDLLVGAPGSSSGDGAAFLFRGEELLAGDPEPALRITSELKGARLGYEVSIAEGTENASSRFYLGAPRANPSSSNATFYSGVLYRFSGDVLDTSDSDSLVSSDAELSWYTPVGYRRTGARFVLTDTDSEELILLLGSD